MKDSFGTHYSIFSFILLFGLFTQPAFPNNESPAYNISPGAFQAPNNQGIIQLSENAEISLMTCGPGDELYSLFGHSALWVYDMANNIDLIFNYGTFDFTDSNFYYLFLRGIANYKLSISDSRSFIYEYDSLNRYVKQQLLNISFEEKQRLFEKLIDNYRPENRYYRYDFLFLNCSSIIRDRVFEVTDNRYSVEPESDEQITFRDLLQPYLNPGWIDLGINLLLSHRADRKASNWEKMFLPDHMFEQFSLARSSDSEQLAPDQETHTLILSTREAVQKRNHNGITTIIAVILVIIILLNNKRMIAKPWQKGIDLFVFFITGLIGILLAFMWFFSKHEVVHENINLLWAFPLHLIFAFIIFFPKLYGVQRGYARVFLVIGILFFILVIAGLQVVPTGILLITSIVLIRLFRISFLLPVADQKKNKQAY